MPRARSSVTFAAMAVALGCGGDPSVAPDAADAPSLDAPADADIDAPIDAGSVDATPPPPMPDPATVAGPLTIATWGPRPFLTPAAIDEVLQSGFSVGREFFVATWVAAPNATRPNLDGLGPLLHAPSCLACHPATGRPPTLGADGSVAAGMLFRLSRPDGAGGLVGDPIFGGQLQPSAIPGVPAEGSVRATFPDAAPPGVSAASRRPVFAVTTAAEYGALAPTTRAGARLSPHLAGMGLLEAIADDALVALEDPLDADGDGVSGRVARLPDGALGRFGWKAVQPSLRGQTAGAFAGDMGITSSARRDDCTASQTACTAAPHGGEPELVDADVLAVDIFMRFLGVPAARRDNADATMARGHALYVAVGCDACHRSALRTAPDATPAVLADVTFHPYTDLLLHDLGPGLADALGEGDASAAEWRTPPLWGLGLVAADPAARFLHDGRAATITDAILWHGGEATAARDRFAALSPDDAAALLAYLNSL